MRHKHNHYSPHLPARRCNIPAGVPIFRSSVCHITGLPYYAPNFDTSGDRAWSIVQQGTRQYISFGSTIHLETDGASPKVATPGFHIPADVNIKLYNKYTKNTGSLGKYTYAVKLYNGTEGTGLISHNSNTKGSYEYNVETSFSKSWNRMICSYSYKAMGNSVTINDFDITYR